MDRYKRQIPVGMQDTLPNECAHKRALTERLRKVFLQSGYFEIETPSYEYYDVFASGIGSVRQEKVQKFFDEHGRILVLRPDLTMPIARIAATRLYEGVPLRLCYVGSAFGTDDAYFAAQKEFTQAGVEYIGVSCPEADAEMISTAIEALSEAGISDYIIELGQVEFFKALMEECGVRGEALQKLRSYVDEKNDLAVELYLKNSGLDSRVIDRIKQLTTLYGGEEVFDRALEVSSSPRCKVAIDNLREIYSLLCDFGLSRRVSIDLGMLQSLDYYSGMVFKGISSRIGQPLLSGGRYDRLISEFGADAPATGFCMYVKHMLVALERQGALAGEPRVEAVISADRSRRAEAYRRATELRAKGVVAELALHLDREALADYARIKCASPVYLEEV